MDKIVFALLSRIAKLHSKQRQMLLAIDGRCAAGKTTLAANLQAKTGCVVLHMDHFFLQPDQRTEERLRQPGGNVDYERFQREVLLQLKEGRPFSYRPFDCHRLEMGQPIQIVPTPLAIVEGSYSCHPRLWDFYDLRIFLTIHPQEQLRRIEKRNGRAEVVPFQDKWIPMEETYFTAYSIQERCDFRFQTDSIPER